MIKIAIVEDVLEDMNILSEQLNKFFKSNNILFELTKYQNGMDFLKAFKSQYQIIFLDMEMPLLGGMNTAKEIRKYDSSVVIIFVTRIEGYAVQGYNVDAAAYLLKPVNGFNINNALQKAVNMLARKEEKEISIKTQSGVTVISANSIFYCEISGHTMIYHTDRGKIISHETMAAVEKKLEAGSFSRCGNSFLINLKYVRSIENNMVKMPKNILPLSRSRKKDFTKDLMLYLGGRK